VFPLRSLATGTSGNATPCDRSDFTHGVVSSEERDLELGCTARSVSLFAAERNGNTVKGLSYLNYRAPSPIRKRQPPFDPPMTLGTSL